VGRLFWKFFFSILLAQLAATVAIGGAVWLKNRDAVQRQQRDIDTGPPAELAIEAAAATLQHGGVPALRTLLENMDRLRVFAVDDKGHELLGRIVKPLLLVEARQMLKADSSQRSVREATGSDGRQYLLFLPSREHLGGQFGYAPLMTRAGMAGLDGLGMRRNDGAPWAQPGTPYGPRPIPGGGQAGQNGPGPGPDMQGGRPPRFQPLAPYIPVVAAVLASLLFAALLAWYFSRPIRSLRLAFAAASGGDLSPRFADAPGKRGDELTDLGRDFDHMTARLRSLIDGQTRLLHDVSHELRSPLARLQAAIGLAYQQPDKARASLERIERESVRMDKLIGELLALSRLEAGAIDAMQEEISIAELLGGIAEDARYEAAARHVEIAQIGETVVADVAVTGQADLLARAIENVVRNAVKHSHEGGEVVIDASLNGAGRQLRIDILDRGPGVAPDELKAIFEPFFRGSGTAPGTSGHGLGLAIAQQVIHAHRGAIIARNRSGGGLHVSISLPVAA